MKKLRTLALLLALCLLLTGNPLPSQAADSTSTGRTSLYGQTMLVLGDSYTAGFGLPGGRHGWPDLVSEALGLTQLNYSISGSSMAAGPRGNYPMVERCLELPAAPSPDIILLQGGSNDHVRDIPLGGTQDRNAENFCGALNLILDHLQETYPSARILCFTPWISDGGKNSLDLTAEDYTAAMCAVCIHRNIPCYNASQAEQNGMHLEEQAFRARFCLSSTDRYHLNDAGHRRFAPVMAEYLSNTLSGSAAVDRFADLQIAGDSLRQGIACVVSTGLMTAEGELFAPTRSAAWSTLSQALYVLSDQPLVTEYDIPAIPRDSLEYRAACYMIQSGLLPGPDSYLPDQPLSREVLSSVLYHYYTSLRGFTVTKYVGLGPYPDSDAVSDYANLPLGWALDQHLLLEKDGLLRPGSTVSRGDLAVTLEKFLRLLGEIS